jgi:N-ethylmaleimide reductase
MMEYYVQRASAGLIVTECTQVSDQGHGIIRAPGLHRQDQSTRGDRSWTAFTPPVADLLSAMALRPRLAPDIRNGALPVAPSAVAASGSFYLPSWPC